MLNNLVKFSFEWFSCALCKIVEKCCSSWSHSNENSHNHNCQKRNILISRQHQERNYLIVRFCFQSWTICFLSLKGTFNQSCYVLMRLRDQKPNKSSFSMCNMLRSISWKFIKIRILNLLLHCSIVKFVETLIDWCR